MWKKLISLNLVLLLLLTLLPIGAAAESAGLKDEWGETSFNAQAGGISSRFLFTEDGEQLTPETFDVSADICSVSWSGRGRVELNGTDLRPGVSGTLTAVRKADGKIFTMPIMVYLPSYAYFRTNEFTDAAFITSLDNGRINYADDPALRTVYLIGFDLSAPVNVSGSGEISWQYLGGSETKAISFTLSPSAIGTHSISFTVTLYGQEQNVTLFFSDGTALRTQWMNVFTVPIGNNNNNILYMEDGTAITEAEFDLSADICPVRWNNWGQGDHVMLDGTKLTGSDVGRTGTLTATRKADGKRFTMPIIVELPWIGWFTTEEITPASFAAPALNAVTINYTEHPAQRTLYLLISKNNGDQFGPLSSVNGSGSITVEWVSSKEISVQLDPAASGTHSISFSYGWGDHVETRSITFTDGLILLTTNGQARLDVEQPNITNYMLKTIDGTVLTPEEFDIISGIGSAYWTEQWVSIDVRNAQFGQEGNLTATRKADGKTYSIPVRAIAPFLGWYSRPEQTADALISGRMPELLWNYTSKGLPNLYLMIRGGRSFTVEADNPYIEWSRIKTAQGESAAVITLAPEVSGTFETWLTLKDDSGQTVSTIPAIFTDGAAMFPSYRSVSISTVGHGSNGFHMIDGDLQPVTEADYPVLTITSGLGNVFWDESGSLCWDAREVGAGLSGTITAASADGSKTLSIPAFTVLPERGFYSEPVRNEETYLQPYDYFGTYSEEEGRTVYYLAVASNSDLCFFEAESSNEKIKLEYESGMPGLKITLDADAEGEVSTGVTYLARYEYYNQRTEQIEWSRDYRGTFQVHFRPAGAVAQHLGVRLVLPPSEEYVFSGNYSGYGQPIGTISYIRPKLYNDGAWQIFTGELVCSDPGVLNAELYDPVQHIWKLTTLSRNHALLQGVKDGKTYSIVINPNEEPNPDEPLFFESVSLPREDYQIDPRTYSGFSVKAGSPQLVQFLLNGAVAEQEPEYDHTLIALEKLTDLPIDGVYKVTAIREGEGEIGVGGVTVKVFSRVPPAIPGDVTGNGQVAQEDVIALFQAVSGQENPGQETPGPEVLDVNLDGKVSNLDALFLFRSLAGSVT